MSVTEGMDVERVRSIAAQLGSSTDRLRQVHGAGSGSMRVLDDAWAGADLGGFSARWDGGAHSLEAAASALQQLQRELLRQADDQDRASGEVGSGGDGSGAPGPRAPSEDPFEDLFGDGDEGGWSLPDPLGGLGDAWDRGTEAFGDAWDWGMDRGRDAVEWGADRGRDALEWVGDRGSDLAEAAKGFWDNEVVSRWDAGLEALGRLGPSIGNFGGQFTQVFTEGRWPRVHELAASAMLLLGRTGGLTANVVTGEDHGVFDSGRGVVTSENEISTETPDGRGRVPIDLDALMDIQSDTYDNVEGRESENRHVRVTSVAQPDGSVAYIVTVPGTNGLFDFPGSITGGEEAFDNTSNLELQAGQRSASMEAVMDAMDRAGIPRGAPVMLQGHSQGGMVTGELVQDGDFMDRYNVTHMITEGSPNDSRSILGSVQTLAIEHTNDLVPKVDLGDQLVGERVAIPLPSPMSDVTLLPGFVNVPPALAGSGGHVTQVQIDPNPGVAPFGVPDEMNAHHYDQYADSVRREIQAGNPAFGDYANGPGIDVFLTDDPDSVTIIEYGTGRE